MQPPPSWDPSLSVGNDLIDSQHKRLARICGKLAVLIVDDGPTAATDFHVALNDLADYARTHFDTEEALLKECAYPNLASHMSEHSEFLEQLSEFLFAATKGLLAKEQLYQFLTTWWAHHVGNSDVQYAGFLRANLKQV